MQISFCLSWSPDKQKRQFSAPSVVRPIRQARGPEALEGRLCSDSFFICDNLRKSAVSYSALSPSFGGLFLNAWCPVRHCGSPCGRSFPLKCYLFIHDIFPQGEPRGIPTRQRSICSPEALFHRASALFPYSCSRNSTKNFFA